MTQPTPSPATVASVLAWARRYNLARHRAEPVSALLYYEQLLYLQASRFRREG